MKHTRASRAALSIAVALLLAGCGQTKSNSAGATSRVVDINMTDNAFTPNNLQVGRGESVTLRFHNNGAVVHEAVIGNDSFQTEHHKEMTSGSTMGSTATTMAMGHSGMDTATAGDTETVVKPGQTTEAKYTFAESGTVLIGCHQPGHWEAGMKATVTVQ